MPVADEERHAFVERRERKGGNLKLRSLYSEYYPPPSNLIVDVMYVRESEKENMRLRQRNHTFKCNPRPSLQTRRCRGKEGERHVRAAEPQSNKKYPPSLRKLRQTPLLSKTWVPGRGRANRLSPFVPRPPPLPRPEVSEASL